MARRLFLVGLAALATACSTAATPLAPTDVRRLRLPAAFDVSALDCQLHPERCQVLQLGATWLALHQSGSCHSWGSEAWGLLNAPSGEGGFKPAPPYLEAEYGQQMMMGVEMNGPGMSSPSGFVRIGAYIYVFEAFWASGQDAVSTGQLLAHELTHYRGEDGPAHNTGLANYNQYVVCPREF